MAEKKIISIIETYSVADGKREEVCRLPKRIEAPNWSLDGKSLYYNGGGLIWRYDFADHSHHHIDTGNMTKCNNDHVLSPDGKMIAISSYPGDAEGHGSLIYILPIEGGTPRQITEKGPSYLHGWSPDGSTLAYCAMRDEFGGDIFTVSVNGGEETRLTKVMGLNDGPEYSPDGKEIWFQSVRSGLMQIYKMNADGSEQTPMTDDYSNNWFPHISPDGEKVVYIAYKVGDVDPGAHPADKNVTLHLMNRDGSDNKVVVELFGGQGTLNVNSWSPDSKKFAFVSYIVEE